MEIVHRQGDDSSERGGKFGPSDARPLRDTFSTPGFMAEHGNTGQGISKKNGMMKVHLIQVADIMRQSQYCR